MLPRKNWKPPVTAESAENRESPESLPGTARKRFYHSPSCYPVSQGKGHFQAASVQSLQDEIEQLMREKNALYNEYREKKENVRELQ